MIKNVEVSFLKVSAAGNRFLIAQGKPSFQGPALTKKIQEWCGTPNGFATDGCLWLEDKGHGSYLWHFYNSDGSTAEMCGNAACSAVYYLTLNGKPTEGVTFETASGRVQVEQVMDAFPLNYAVSLNVPHYLEKNIDTEIEGKTVKGSWIDSGVPHLVLETDLQTFPKDFEWERKIRFHEKFKPRGTNVTYVDTKTNPARAVTYERGVEGYTEACGTGALAAAFYIYEKKQQNPINIEMPGGKLRVSLQNKKVILHSPVFIHGEVNIFKDTP
jgi:diaminopimelate epimerase